MRRLYDIELLDDTQLQGQMAMWSLWALLLGTLIGVLGAAAFPHEPLSIWWFLELVVVSVAVLPVHELIHALAFKVCSGFESKIKFGFKDWMLYTCSPGTMLPRGRFCVVLLAPLVVVTASIGIVLAMCGQPLLAWFCAVVHLAGCTGDLGYVRIIVSEPKANLIEDTEHGIALFHDA